MDKELAKFAQNEAMQEALEEAFNIVLGDAIVSKVMQGESVVGYKEAKEIMNTTIRRIKVEFARSKK